jgi:hypothetical protein
MRAKKGTGTARDWVLLALVQHRVGKDKEAREQLDKANRCLARARQEKKDKADGNAPAWNRRLELELLCREVEGLLEERKP